MKWFSARDSVLHACTWHVARPSESTKNTRLRHVYFSAARISGKIPRAWIYPARETIRQFFNIEGLTD